MRPTPIPPLRPLAVLLLTAAAAVWVVGDHWGEGGSSGERHWAWTAAASLLCTASVWLLGLAEVERRRRRPPTR